MTASKLQQQIIIYREPKRQAEKIFTKSKCNSLARAREGVQYYGEAFQIKLMPYFSLGNVKKRHVKKQKLNVKKSVHTNNKKRF